MFQEVTVDVAGSNLSEQEIAVVPRSNCRYRYELLLLQGMTVVNGSNFCCRQELQLLQAIGTSLGSVIVLAFLRVNNCCCFGPCRKFPAFVAKVEKQFADLVMSAKQVGVWFQSGNPVFCLL